MRFIYEEHNMHYNCIGATTFYGYILRIGYSKAEERLKTFRSSECELNALAIDNL